MMQYDQKIGDIRPVANKSTPQHSIEAKIMANGFHTSYQPMPHYHIIPHMPYQPQPIIKQEVQSNCFMIQNQKSFQSTSPKFVQLYDAAYGPPPPGMTVQKTYVLVPQETSEIVENHVNKVAKLPKKQRANKARTSTLHADLPEFKELTKLIEDQNVTFNPDEIGLLTGRINWESPVTFGTIVREFFQLPMSANTRFQCKLYTALRLSDVFPQFSHVFGVQWVTPFVFKVSKIAFGILLGLQSIEGALFHSQGNFPTHGFVEVDSTTAKSLNIHDTSVDFINVVLMTHKENHFYRGMGKNEVKKLTYTNDRKRYYKRKRVEGSDDNFTPSSPLSTVQSPKSPKSPTANLKPLPTPKKITPKLQFPPPLPSFVQLPVPGQIPISTGP